MDDCVVIFKATVDGFYLVLREEDAFEAVYRQIEKKLESAGKFFKGATMSVKYRGKKLSDEEETMIRDLMVERTDAVITGFSEDTSEPPDPKESENEGSRNKPVMKKLHFNGINEGMTRFYRGTVRSGQLVTCEGNLVVIGDVNPGGEVNAAGNVIVMGSLRGNVHAGSDGNKEAIVAALNLQPMLLKIANVITRSPDEKNPNGVSVPEMAYVKDEAVYIERFLPQFK